MGSGTGHILVRFVSCVARGTLACVRTTTAFVCRLHRVKDASRGCNAVIGWSGGCVPFSIRLATGIVALCTPHGRYYLHLGRSEFIVQPGTEQHAHFIKTYDMLPVINNMRIAPRYLWYLLLVLGLIISLVFAWRLGLTYCCSFHPPIDEGDFRVTASLPPAARTKTQYSSCPGVRMISRPLSTAVCIYEHLYYVKRANTDDTFLDTLVFFFFFSQIRYTAMAPSILLRQEDKVTVSSGSGDITATFGSAALDNDVDLSGLVATSAVIVW